MTTEKGTFLIWERTLFFFGLDRVSLLCSVSKVIIVACLPFPFSSQDEFCDPPKEGYDSRVMLSNYERSLELWGTPTVGIRCHTTTTTTTKRCQSGQKKLLCSSTITGLLIPEAPKLSSKCVAERKHYGKPEQVAVVYPLCTLFKVFLSHSNLPSPSNTYTSKGKKKHCQDRKSISQNTHPDSPWHRKQREKSKSVDSEDG